MLKTLDGIATGVSKSLDIDDVEEHDTHDGDRIGSTEIGRLARSKNKVIINTSESFQDIISNFHRVGKSFSKISKNKENLSIIKKKHAETAHNKKMTIDMSAT